MDVLILGGTAWLGRHISIAAMARGHHVTCLARGSSGRVAPGATLVEADRSEPGAYETVRRQDWDAVFDVSWQPAFVRDALAALAGRSAFWGYVSSSSVYADTIGRGRDEDSVALLEPTTLDRVEREQYGPAKVACEQLARGAVADRLLIARAGLIGGPGDGFDRVGAWVARAARSPRDRLLVPEPGVCPTQVIDVRDLAGWLVGCAEQQVVGTMNAVGPVLPFADWVALSREVGGHTGPVVVAPREWLVEREIDWFMGPESLAMWLPGPEHYGFSDRDGSRAQSAGLTHRPRRELLIDVLADERHRGLDRDRLAGLSAAYEQSLLRTLGR